MTELELTKFELNMAKAHIKFFKGQIKLKNLIIEELKQKLREAKCTKPIEQRINNYFNRGHGDWDKLYDFMDKESFSRADFLACVCASLLREPENEFETELGIGGIKFGINIRKK